MIISGEFHYWRLPDRSRWEHVLKQYKAAGLNCIRIYFHWGYHSPNEGIYYFDDNRDVDYLLKICEKLRLFVMCAPGPYICAETQAGGLPIWLTAKRHIRLRHSVNSFFRRYDTEYSKYCAEWFSALIPHLEKHQITAKNGGCVIAFQIENEAFEIFKGIPLGLTDDMRHLCKTARDLGITVPFFTNDAWEEGSFVTRPSSYRVLGKKSFGIDLFGFDKYIVFCPTSAPLATLSGSNTSKTSWGEWNPRDVVFGLEGMEDRVRKIGGGASESPIFIPELQGGWFNHYTVKHTYDDVYSYYGENYTKMVLDSVLSQGVTAFSYYMFYGGTNWGTIGDPDVYTSYDYSACIRENGHLSGRGRKLRLGISFIRSFGNSFSRTNAVKKSSISGDFLIRHRRSIDSSKIEFAFFRNFDSSKKTKSFVSINYGNGNHVLPISMPYKQSFIGLSNYAINDSLYLVLSTIPIYIRTFVKIDGKASELWIVQCDESFNGALAFEGKFVIIPGTLNPSVDKSIVSWEPPSGWFAISTKSGVIDLYIICLSGTDLYTLQPHFEESYWSAEKPHRLNEIPLSIFFGSYGAHFDSESNSIEIEHSSLDIGKTLYAISGVGKMPGFKAVTTGKYSNLPFLFCRDLPSVDLKKRLDFISLPTCEDWTKKSVDFIKLPWQGLAMKSKSEPHLDPIDFAFTSGHCLYRLQFCLENVHDLTLDINIRHRASVYLNNNFASNHTVYNLGVFRAGSKNGPDNTFGGWKSIRLASDYMKKGNNELIVLVESFGLNRQPFAFNDIRNKRGIIEARIKGVSKIDWDICGIDVRLLKEAYNISGIPEQPTIGNEIPFEGVICEGNITKISLSGIDMPTWFSSKFDFVSIAENVRQPLRLNVNGAATGYISINGIIIARYYGNGDGPQKDFYIPDGIIKKHDNDIKILAYRSSDDDGEYISVEFKLYKMDRLDAWSGNIQEDGKPFMIISEIVV